LLQQLQQGGIISQKAICHKTGMRNKC